MTRVRKSGLISSRPSISADTSFRRDFGSSSKFLQHHSTQYFHVQILSNNLVDCTSINIKLIGDDSNCQPLILKNESPHTVNVCALSHRGGAFRSWFIFHGVSPMCKVFVPPKYLST
jgi:hypothetical protein